MVVLARGYKVVTVRANRFCGQCKGVIPKGTRCATISSRGFGRSWYHLPCADYSYERDLAEQEARWRYAETAIDEF